MKFIKRSNEENLEDKARMLCLIKNTEVIKMIDSKPSMTGIPQISWFKRNLQKIGLAALIATGTGSTIGYIRHKEHQTIIQQNDRVVRRLTVITNEIRSLKNFFDYERACFIPSNGYNLANLRINILRAKTIIRELEQMLRPASASAAIPSHSRALVHLRLAEAHMLLEHRHGAIGNIPETGIEEQEILGLTGLSNLDNAIDHYSRALGEGSLNSNERESAVRGLLSARLLHINDVNDTSVSATDERTFLGNTEPIPYDAVYAGDRYLNDQLREENRRQLLSNNSRTEALRLIEIEIARLGNQNPSLKIWLLTKKIQLNSMTSTQSLVESAPDIQEIARIIQSRITANLPLDRAVAMEFVKATQMVAWLAIYAERGNEAEALLRNVVNLSSSEIASGSPLVSLQSLLNNPTLRATITSTLTANPALKLSVFYYLTYARAANWRYAPHCRWENCPTQGAASPELLDPNPLDPHVEYLFLALGIDPHQSQEALMVQLDRAAHRSRESAFIVMTIRYHCHEYFGGMPNC